jgi:hypothetical protein
MTDIESLMYWYFCFFVFCVMSTSSEFVLSFDGLGMQTKYHNIIFLLCFLVSCLHQLYFLVIIIIIHSEIHVYMNLMFFLIPAVFYIAHIAVFHYILKLR